ncbi:MAG: GGDEF domain-containing protein [Chromatiales bacterium]|nr:GGDEF domain-containing protein [Chromatiales bacterium]
MDAGPFIEAANELRGRFFSLIDSLSALRDLSGIEVERRSESDLLRDALSILLRYQDFERCSVFVSADGALTCAAGLDWEQMLSTPVRSPSPGRSAALFALGEGIMGEAARTGEPVVCADCARDRRFAPRHDAGIEVIGGSLVATPVICRGEVIGVVNVYHPQSHHFDEWHLRVLHLFCDVLAHLIDNARLLRRMELAVDSRTRQLETALREAEQLKRRYEQLSNVDELTGLHNRRFFFPEAEAAVSRAVRHGYDFAVLIVDVDHFKQVNDQYGHGMGDRVLIDVAAEIRRQVRAGDILARFGGEEFAIALPSTPQTGARLLAERVRESVRAMSWQLSETTLQVTVSIGVSCLEGRRGGAGPVLEQMLREADRAMYAAKHGGRDQVSVEPPGTPETPADEQGPATDAS